MKVKGSYQNFKWSQVAGIFVRVALINTSKITVVSKIKNTNQGPFWYFTFFVMIDDIYIINISKSFLTLTVHPKR